MTHQSNGAQFSCDSCWCAFSSESQIHKFKFFFTSQWPKRDTNCTLESAAIPVHLFVCVLVSFCLYYGQPKSLQGCRKSKISYNVASKTLQWIMFYFNCKICKVLVWGKRIKNNQYLCIKSVDVNNNNNKNCHYNRKTNVQMCSLSEKWSRHPSIWLNHFWNAMPFTVYANFSSQNPKTLFQDFLKVTRVQMGKNTRAL